MAIDPSTLDPSNDALWASPVPDGETRMVENAPSSASGLNEVGIATTVVALICVIARLFTRIWVVRGVGADDYLIVISMALSLAFLGMILASMPIGAGNHVWDVPAVNFMDFMKYQMIITVLYSSAVTFSKLSILTFYLRLSVQGPFRWTVYALIGTVTVYTIVYEFLIIFQCTPVAKFWKPTMDGSCIGRMIPMMTLSVANALIDIVILLIPLKVVIPLKISTRQKVSLILLFGTGGVVCAATIKRTVILPGLLNATDYTWAVPPQMVWGYVEINAGLVCASVPALKPLFMRYLPFIIGSKIYSNDRSGATPGYGSRSNPLSSNKNRSKMAAQSYELHSQDNFPSRPNQEDDEAKLWGHTTISHKKEGPNKVKSGKNGSDDDSVDSIEGHYPGRIGRSTVVSGWGRNNSLSGGGINVTKETKVFYESS